MKRFETIEEAIELYPFLAYECYALKDAEPRMKVGDRFSEDRSRYIGSMREHPSDKTHSQCTFEVLQVVKERGVYWLWNETREVNTIGMIRRIDGDTEFITRLEKKDD